MNISVAVTSDDEHKLHKNLSILGSYTGTLKDECSIENPSIMIQMPEATAQQANYAAITAGTELNRTYYYFITDKVFVRDGLVRLTMRCDYLMTFESEIRNLVCTIDKNENDSDSYLYDENYKIDAYSNIMTRTFPQGFEDESMILLVVG